LYQDSLALQVALSKANIGFFDETQMKVIEEMAIIVGCKTAIAGRASPRALRAV